MENLKYYVLWTKNSSLLKKYFEKYYNLLLDRLEKLAKNWYLKNKIGLLLENKYKREFIMNADNSSVINYLYLELVEWLPQFLWDIEKYKNIFKNEIEIFLKQWINSANLTMNKWQKIAWTNIRLTSFDNSPYSKKEAHPEHIKEWAISWNWWEKKQDDWLVIYKKSFDLLKDLDEWIYDELNQIITKIIPLWTARWKHNSASYKEAIGHLYMWYTINSSSPEINNLEAIIHESSHNKLNLLFQFDPIVLNTKEEIYYSAIRPDARHIHWVFLGYHAFAPTMYIIMKAYKDWHLWNDSMWFNKIVLYYIKTKFLQKVIKKYAKLTDLWKKISNEIDYVISLMDDLLKQLKPTKEQLLNARKIQEQHFQSVNKNYPYLKY